MRISEFVKLINEKQQAETNLYKRAEYFLAQFRGETDQDVKEFYQRACEFYMALVYHVREEIKQLERVQLPGDFSGSQSVEFTI